MIALTVAWLTLMAASWADAAPKDERESRESDEYSFSWLDPDKKIYVLQNRRYLKTNRLMLSVMGGVGASNPYRSTMNFDPRIAFYPAESWGFEVFYTKTSNSANTTYDALKSAVSSIQPIVREIQSQMGGLAHWSPWYAKINVFNNILYFDWYFSLGVGQLQTSYTKKESSLDPLVSADENFTGFFFGTGHHYYLNEHFSVRLDFMGAAYNAPTGGTSGTAWYSNYNFDFGLSYRL